MRRLVILMSILILGAGASSARAGTGYARIYLDSTSMPEFLNPELPTEAERSAWVKAHFSLLKTPYCSGCEAFKESVNSGVPTTAYTDALREKSPITPTGRKEITAYEKEAKEHGAQGAWLDDMNFGGGCDGSQTCTKLEREEYVALLRELRALGSRSTYIIDFNSHWGNHKQLWEEKEPLFIEALELTTLVHQERGVGELTSKSLFDGYVLFAKEALAKYGTHVLLGGNYEAINKAIKNEGCGTEAQCVEKRNELQEDEFAAFYVINDGQDYVGGATRGEASPSRFWGGWCVPAHTPCTTTDTNLDLGEPYSEIPEAIKTGSGAYARYFGAGAKNWVFAVPTGNASVSWEWVGINFRSFEWGSGLHSLTLAQKQGAVLVRE